VQRNLFGLKIEGDQAKFLTWCTYKEGGPSSHSKKVRVWTPCPPAPPKIKIQNRTCWSLLSTFVKSFYLPCPPWHRGYYVFKKVGSEPLVPPKITLMQVRYKTERY